MLLCFLAAIALLKPSQGAASLSPTLVFKVRAKTLYSSH